MFRDPDEYCLQLCILRAPFPTELHARVLNYLSQGGLSAFQSTAYAIAENCKIDPRLVMQVVSDLQREGLVKMNKPEDA